ncbi:MAG: galactokinase [Acidobacteriota bacterium]
MTFEQLFGHPATVRAEAPGRVNLIGEHTDYNGGFVLPTVVPQRTRIDLARRDDRRVRVWSAAISPPQAFVEFRLGEEAPKRGWADYLQGVTAGLLRRGHDLGGFDARVESAVPLGSGVSSSAALEVSLARALRAAFCLRLDDIELAMVGRWAENEFVGAPTGIMDQMVVSLGEPGAALFLDTRSLRFERVPIPASIELVVIDSGVRHALMSGEYAVRRSQCEEACRLLGVEQLRDVSVADLARVDALPDPLCRRARHVLTENDRVRRAVAALRADDPGHLGDLFYVSHVSMRDDYQVSVPAVDALVEIASADPDVFGARLTGGGFGGAVVILVRAGRSREAARRIAEAYATATEHAPTVLVPVPDERR